MTHIGLRILSLITPKLGYLEIFTINNFLYVILYIVNVQWVDAHDQVRLNLLIKYLFIYNPSLSVYLGSTNLV